MSRPDRFEPLSRDNRSTRAGRAWHRAGRAVGATMPRLPAPSQGRYRMWDRMGRSRFRSGRAGQGATARARHRWARRPQPEILEDRRLLTAALAAIPNVTVPAQEGYTLPLDGSGTTDAQNFTVTLTSGSPAITASIAQGPFWTINTQYTDPTNMNNSFTGALTFQLFQNLTPQTVGMIQTFTNDGYYNGKNFTRIANQFPGATDYILQGGAPNADGSGSSGLSGTPFANEIVQQLAFSGQDQLAMANAGPDPSLPNYARDVNTNDTQFFITTTGSPHFLDYGYTIFGQLVSGVSTLAKMTQVPVQYSSVYRADVAPANPLVMSSATMSATNPNGVVLIDTTQAKPGESATFLVTATDPRGGLPVSQSFTVTVGPYSESNDPSPTDPAIDFKPYNGGPTTATTPYNTATTVTLPAGTSGYPDSTAPTSLSYALASQPSHGTISNFNPTAGTFTYTPKPGFVGTDTFQYEVQETGPTPPIGADPTTGQELFGPSTTTVSNPATVTVTVTPATPTITWPRPASIVYGMALSATQLDATASVPGRFTYSPPTGTVLPAGSNQPLSVTFTPMDTTDYTTTTTSVSLS